MRPHLSQSQIRPKISTMPRQKTEAAAYLDIYKLVNERKRLQEELETLEQRRDRIQKRLDVLNAQVNELEHSAHQLRHLTTPPASTNASNEALDTDTFSTFFLDY